MSARGLAPGLADAVGAEIRHRLAALELRASAHPRPVDLELVREGLRVLIGTWRRLLAAHAADEDGRCPECPRGWLRRRRWPCAVWTVAHEHLVTLEGPAPRVPAQTARGVRSGAPRLRSGTGSATPRPGVTLIARHARSGAHHRKECA